MGSHHVDLKLISNDAIYRDDEGTRQAAVAAGGVIVDDSRAPGHTVIADPDGNKACVGTFQPPAV